MKGIILAAGAGTRLAPVSTPVSKTLLPVYDKPMIYYPLSTLLAAGVDDVLVITSEEDRDGFARLLDDGSRFGISIRYLVQHEKRGIADAFLIAEDFIGGDDVWLILGDNIFHSENMDAFLAEARERRNGAVVFAYPVKDPERFGVVELDPAGRPVSLEEKPAAPRSDLAVTGLYYYDGRACSFAKRLSPSGRGELEITDLNRLYLDDGSLDVVRMDGVSWIDAGTFDSLLEAGNFVRNIERTSGKKICCPEETAFLMGLISGSSVRRMYERNRGSGYYEYLARACRQDP